MSELSESPRAWPRAQSCYLLLLRLRFLGRLLLGLIFLVGRPAIKRREEFCSKADYHFHNATGTEEPNNRIHPTAIQRSERGRSKRVIPALISSRNFSHFNLERLKFTCILVRAGQRLMEL